MIFTTLASHPCGDPSREGAVVGLCQVKAETGTIGG